MAHWRGRLLVAGHWRLVVVGHGHRAHGHIREIAGGRCRGKKRRRSVRGLERLVSCISLSEDRLSGSLLANDLGADWLLVPTAAEEASFPEVALVD